MLWTTAEECFKKKICRACWVTDVVLPGNCSSSYSVEEFLLGLCGQEAVFLFQKNLLDTTDHASESICSDYERVQSWVHGPCLLSEHFVHWARHWHHLILLISPLSSCSHLLTFTLSHCACTYIGCSETVSEKFTMYKSPYSSFCAGGKIIFPPPF